MEQPRTVSLSGAWKPVGPLQIASSAYGNVTGRISAIAIDPADASGNTVYLGTTGGGVWKSVNAAGPAASVAFLPLTDTLPVFSLDAGNSSIASLSIGTLSVANGVVLAGTGDPNDALDSYYGSGLLRSADGGATWTLVQESHDGLNGNHSFIGLGFAGFAFSSVTPSTVVAAVSDAAEGLLVNAEDTTYSTRGLYFSNDAGVTWEMAIIKDGSQIVQSPLAAGGNLGGNAATSVAWNPVRQRFYAAVRYHGYYESADGSVWTRLAAQPGAGLTAVSCPASPGTTGSANCPIFRGAIAVEPASGDTYALSVDANNIDQGIWRDICASGGGGSSCASAVAFGSRLNTAPLEQGSGSTAIMQGDYDLSLAAVASAADTLVFAGTVDLYRCSLNAGCVFRNTTNTLNGCSAPAMVAPAQHAIAALSTGLLYLGNDGGLWRSTDGVDQVGEPCSASDAGHFQNLNPALGSLAEVVSFAQHSTDANTLLVGVGANGTAATSAAASNLPWPQLAAGEGGFTAIDQTTPANWYISTAAGVAIKHCGNGTSCGATDFAGLPTIGPGQVADDASLIDAPWILDPEASSNVAIGTCRVWRGPAADGSSWSGANAISRAFGGPQNAACGGTNPLVRSLAAGGPISSATAPANAGSKVLYAGMAGVLDGGGSLGGHLFSTTAGDTASKTTPWVDLALSSVTNDASDGGVFNPGGFDLSSVVLDTHDATGLTVYATVMGFAGNGTNAPHVYRSIDGGAHWSNISSNLPNAPANGLAIDPNDANTVYVAMDIGVYAATQVSTCASANCWGVFGVGLPNAPVVGLTAAPGISTGSGSTGELRAATYGRGIWQIPLLSAAPPVSAMITLAPASLSFSAKAVGSASTAQTITLTNSGTASLSISSVAITGDFAESDNCTASPLAIGGTCSVQVTFLPTVVGTRTGILTVYGNVAGGQATAALSGIGAAPAAVMLDPLSLNFGTITAGQTSTTQAITIVNSGGVSATLQAPSITGDFRMMANTCGGTLPNGVECTVTIAFAPTAGGTRDGRFTIADSTGTQITSLTGVGATAATDTLSPLSLSFASQQYNTTSPPQKVTLTNSGDTALSLITAQITGAAFSVVNDCGSSLIGHAACSFLVSFVPTSAGQLTGTLTVSDQLRSQTVSLAGVATAPPLAGLSPSTLSFAATPIGQISATQPVTVTNIGDGELIISNVATTGQFSDTEGCTRISLANNASCTIQVKFAPTSAGTAIGALTVTGNSAAGVATVALSGVGAAPGAIVLTPASVNFGNLTIGATSAAQNITISNTGGAAVTLQTPASSGVFTITANTCGTTLAPSTGCTVAIVFAPTVSGTFSGTFTIKDSVGTQTASLTGVGQSPPTDALAPLSLVFGSQEYDTASATQSVTLTNAGDEALTLIAAQTSKADFTVVNNCGSSLAGHSTCALAVAFVPTRNGPITGTLTVSDQFRAQTVALSGIGVAPPLASLFPANLAFLDTQTGQTSAAQTLTVTNFGGGQLTISKVSASASFVETDGCAGQSLAPNASCAVQVKFSPATLGTATGVLTVFGNMPGGQATAALSGAGVSAATIVLLPTSADFGSVSLGLSSSPALNITISNTGGVQATLGTAAISGDFKISANTCGAAGTSLPPSTGCTVAIIFTPTASGTRSGSFSMTDSVGTQTASLTGIGVAVATDTLTPTSLSFGPQQINTTSATQQLTLTNTGDNALTLIAVQIASGDFIATNGCGPTLIGHNSCAITVASMPRTIGPDTGVLTVSDQFRLQTVLLGGNGTAPPGVSLSPSAGLTFAATGVSQSSAAQTIIVSNQTSAPVTLGGVTASGDFNIPVAGDSCGSSVAADGACTFQVVFAPTATGTRVGSVSVSDSVAGSPQTVALSGTGIDFALVADGPVSATISSGASAVYALLVSSDAGLPGAAVLTCAGAPANATCFVTPATAPLGSTTLITVTVATGVSATAAVRPSRLSPGVQWTILLPLGLCGLLGGRKRLRALRLRSLLGLVVVLGLVFADGCGSGRVIPPPNTPPPPGSPSTPTPTGTYSIVVSGTSAGLTRTVALTLIVQ